MMKKGNLLAALILSALIFTNCGTNEEDESLPLTLHRRSVLDQKVRMLTLRFGEDRYVAYDLQNSSLYQVWRGGVMWNGVSFNNLKQLQPEVYGLPYLVPGQPHISIVSPSGKLDSLQLIFRSYVIDDKSITIKFGIDKDGFEDVVLTEKPQFFEEEDQPLFTRTLTVSGLDVGSTLQLDTLSITEGEGVISYLLDSLPATPYPAGEIVAKTSYYWLDKTGCNTCHTMDYQMVGPSYKAIAARYDPDEETMATLITKVKNGGKGNWGQAAMTPHPDLEEADIDRMVRDILALDPEDAKQGPISVVEAAEDTHTEIPGFGSALVDIHPAYSLQTIRPDRFRPRVGAMEISEDGNLFVATWDSIGAVYKLTGVMSGDTNQIEVKQIASGLAEPLGMELVGDHLYVMQKHELTQLIDLNGDEIVDEYKSICHDFGVTPDFHEFAYDIEFKDGSFYGTLGIAMRLMTTELQLPDRGTAFKVDLDGNFEVITTGLRQPNGIGVGVDGELFTTENQGRWVPACKLIHLREGDFHGCVQRQGDRFDGLRMTPPAVWLPQDEIGNSPSEPLLMTEGPYSGQMIFGEVSHGGMNRAFLEKVDGAYQGCVFRFCQGLEAGINRIVRGPDGALYLGGVGMTGGWSHKGNQYGLQKLVYNDSVPFEMLSISATPDGFDITFTKPLKGGLELDDLPLKLSQWYYQPTAAYGGPKLDKHDLQVTEVNLEDHNRVLRLKVDGLKKEYVIYFLLDPSLLSANGEALWNGEAWYTLNAIPNINL